jgi:hypothetical protein
MHKHGVRPVKCGAHEWVLDSGAWIHHTSNLELLLEGGDFQSQELDNKYAPSSGDDAAALHAQGRGSVRTDCFNFTGVHYVVGDDTRNVVSVSQLARDHGLVTVFEPTSCYVKDKKTGKIVGKGRLRNDMYMLDSLHIVGQVSIYTHLDHLFSNDLEYPASTFSVDLHPSIQLQSIDSIFHMHSI